MTRRLTLTVDGRTVVIDLPATMSEDEVRRAIVEALVRMALDATRQKC